MIRSKLASLAGIAFLVFLISGCAAFTQYGKLEKSARDNYLSKNYDRAVFDVVKSLKINPEYDQAQDLVKMVVPLALDDHLNKIQEAKSGTEKFQWDVVTSEYGALIKLNEAIKSLPILTNKKTKETIKFEVTNYSKELSEAKNNAAEAHYREGVLLSKNGTSTRGQAAKEFTTANSYISGYKDALALAAEGYYQEGVLLSKRGSSTREQAAKEFTTANNYVSGYKDALALAAEGYYQEGLRLSKQQNDVNIQKQAAKEFKTATSFVPGYKDSDALYEKARKAGIKRVAVIPFEDKSGKASKYGAIAETAVDQIVSQVMNNKDAMEFLELMTRDQLENVMREHKLGLTGIMDEKTAMSLGKILGVKEIITGKITSITYAPERTITRSIPQSRQVVVGQRVTGHDKKGREIKEDVYGTINATVTIYTRTAGTSVNGSYSIIDITTAKNMKTDAFTGKYEFKSEWGTCSGDKEALSGEPQRLCQVSEQVSPSEDEMINNAIKNLSNTLADKIISYAK